MIVHLASLGLTLLAIIIESWVQNLCVGKQFHSSVIDFSKHGLHIFAYTDSIIKLSCAYFYFNISHSIFKNLSNNMSDKKLTLVCASCMSSTVLNTLKTPLFILTREMLLLSPLHSCENWDPESLVKHPGLCCWHMIELGFPWRHSGGSTLGHCLSTCSYTSTISSDLESS